MLAAVVWATPRSACRASITARISGGAWRIASSIAFSSFTIRVAHVVHFFQVIGQRGFQRRLLRIARGS